MALQLPTKLHRNRYTLKKLLATGGMGEVYLAYEPSLDRYCAIKRLDLSNLRSAKEVQQAQEAPPPQLQDEMTRPDPADHHRQPTREEAVAQFKREARILARLDHPNLVKVTHFFSSGNSCYLVMDFIEGEDLEKKGRQPESKVLLWIGQVMDALEHCHAQGVIHCDVKPANIIVRDDNKAYLVDFGIAQQAARAMQDTRHRYGTPGYSPPEQFTTEMPTDRRSDIYALGATLYYSLTGRVPPGYVRRADSGSPDRLDGWKLKEPIIPPGDLVNTISPRVQVAIMRAMAFDPHDRFQSIAEFRSALLGQATPGKSASQVVAQPGIIEPRHLRLLAIGSGPSFSNPPRRQRLLPFDFGCGSIPIYAGEKAPVDLMVASAVAPASVFVAWPSGHIRIYAAETGELRGEYQVEPEQPDTILDLASCHRAEKRVCLVLIGSAMRSRPALWAIQMDGKAIPVEGEELKGGAPEGAHHVAYYENSYYFVSESGEGACLHLLEPNQALPEKIPGCIRADDLLVTADSIFVAGLSSGGEHESGCIWVKARGKPGPWNCLAVRMEVSDNGKLRLARYPRERHIYCAYTNSNRQPVVELRDAASGRQISCFRPGGWGTMLGIDAGMNRLYVLEERDKRAVVRWYGLQWLATQPGC